MALRFNCKGAAIAQGGTTIVHGLGLVPDEWNYVLAGPSPGAAALYRTALPTSQNIIVAASGANGTGDVFCSVNHSIMK
jgi:hypothetical protein